MRRKLGVSLKHTTSFRESELCHRCRWFYGDLNLVKVLTKSVTCCAIGKILCMFSVLLERRKRGHFLFELVKN